MVSFAKEIWLLSDANIFQLVQRIYFWNNFSFPYLSLKTRQDK